jgi:hypothetical protein
MSYAISIWPHRKILDCFHTSNPDLLNPSPELTNP